ncbi:glycosyltransferase family 77 protein [Mucor lusitanicus]|uniref:Glycosyltransferase family 77 protein n=2 Tax=Mucor circinelloides f. lusitanicus TaxID=29924 RepID=A0A162TWP8_MUCCL|nr:glycosyltransferase family 77 protein [Mucor lusitanicus]OAD07732.1 glycosyltransferase family 77 protein [Mucor lusitanicus CBS 277.49]
MPEFKSKRYIYYVLTLAVCLLLMAGTFHSTRPKLLASPEVLESNTASNSIQKPANDTSSSHWEPKKYDPPPPETMMAIMNNVISEKEKPSRLNSYSKAQEKKILLMAVVNSGMIDYTLNWIESLRLTRQDDRFLVFAIDQGVVDELASRGYDRQVTLIPNDWFHVPLASDMALWKSNDYRPITHAKSLVVERLLYLGITVWFTDVDIVFLSPFIRQTLLAQMAQRPNTHMIFSQEVDQRSINSGFYMMKPSKITKQFMDQIIQGQDATETLTQQRVMNSVLRQMYPRDLTKSPYRLLDLLLFPNGNYYFKMRLPKRLGIQPLIVHANFLIGDKKKSALKKAGLWYI